MPNRFSPIAADTPFQNALAAINANFAQLDNEGVVKTFNGPNGKPALVQGRLSHGFYGIEYRDTSGRVVKLTGFDDTGAFVDITVKSGYDAYTVLGY